jgi:transposase-like protein
MPWRTESVMDQRVEFVLRARAGAESIAALCRDYGVSRPTGYLWLDRYQEVGSVNGLAEHSRRPLHSPQRIAAAVEAAVLARRCQSSSGYRPANSETAWSSSAARGAENEAAVCP